MRRAQEEEQQPPPQGVTWGLESYRASGAASAGVWSLIRPGSEKRLLDHEKKCSVPSTRREKFIFALKGGTKKSPVLARKFLL